MPFTGQNYGKTVRSCNQENAIDWLPVMVFFNTILCPMYRARRFHIYKTSFGKKVMNLVYHIYNNFDQEFIVEIKKHDMVPVIIEIEKMSVPDFKLKATSKDLQNRLLVIEKSAEEKQLVLLSILAQWEAMRAKLRELLDWIDLKDLKLSELKEQVNLADEDEVNGELKELKVSCLF